MQVCYKINHISQVKNLEEFINGKQNVIKEQAEENPEKYHIPLKIDDLINYKNCKNPYIEDRKFNLKLEDEFYIIWFKYYT